MCRKTTRRGRWAWNRPRTAPLRSRRINSANRPKRSHVPDLNRAASSRVLRSGRLLAIHGLGTQFNLVCLAASRRQRRLPLHPREGVAFREPSENFKDLVGGSRDIPHQGTVQRGVFREMMIRQSLRTGRSALLARLQHHHLARSALRLALTIVRKHPFLQNVGFRGFYKPPALGFDDSVGRKPQFGVQTDQICRIEAIFGHFFVPRGGFPPFS